MSDLTKRLLALELYLSDEDEFQEGEGYSSITLATVASYFFEIAKKIKYAQIPDFIKNPYISLLNKMTYNDASHNNWFLKVFLTDGDQPFNLTKYNGDYIRTLDYLVNLRKLLLVYLVYFSWNKDKMMIKEFHIIVPEFLRRFSTILIANIQVMDTKEQLTNLIKDLNNEMGKVIEAIRLVFTGDQLNDLKKQQVVYLIQHLYSDIFPFDGLENVTEFQKDDYENFVDRLEKSESINQTRLKLDFAKSRYRVKFSLSGFLKKFRVPGSAGADQRLREREKYISLAQKNIVEEKIDSTHNMIRTVENAIAREQDVFNNFSEAKRDGRAKDRTKQQVKDDIDREKKNLENLNRSLENLLGRLGRLNQELQMVSPEIAEDERAMMAKLNRVNMEKEEEDSFERISDEAERRLREMDRKGTMRQLRGPDRPISPDLGLDPQEMEYLRRQDEFEKTFRERKGRERKGKDLSSMFN